MSEHLQNEEEKEEEKRETYRKSGLSMLSKAPANVSINKIFMNTLECFFNAFENFFIIDI